MAVGAGPLPAGIGPFSQRFEVMKMDCCGLYGGGGPPEPPRGVGYDFFLALACLVEAPTLPAVVWAIFRWS
jgi:hypothetical protein